MRFDNKKIVLCVSGSVAAIESPKLARELRRLGATIYPVMSDSAQKIIHPDLLHWACDNKVLTKLTGECEHVKLCGQVPGKADIVIIAPATANTIGKIAAGVDDTPITTIVSTAIGTRIPIIIVPAMHISLYEHELLKKNIQKLKKIHVRFVEPKIQEKKAKFPQISAIIEEIRMALSKKDLEGKKVLVTAGGTIEEIDPIRHISNKSSGKMGVAFADVAASRGAQITLILANSIAKPKHDMEIITANSVLEMKSEIHNYLKKSKDAIVIHAAAVSDFTVKKKENKINSKKNITLQLIPAPKIINEIKKIQPNSFLVGFKAEYDLSKKDLIKKAKQEILKSKADLIIANDIARVGFGNDASEVIIVRKNGAVEEIKGEKLHIAQKVFDIILKWKK